MRRSGTSRRGFLKTSAMLSSAGVLTTGSLEANSSKTTADIKVAGYDYDRVKGIIDGRAGIEGSSVSFHYEDIYAVNQLAFGPQKPYQISELGLIPFVTRYINADFRDYTLVPIFISRVFRHRNVFVHADSDITRPEDLKGKRVATPGYGMSANTWIRGFLQDDYGVAPDEMNWDRDNKVFRCR